MKSWLHSSSRRTLSLGLFNGFIYTDVCELILEMLFNCDCVGDFTVLA